MAQHDCSLLYGPGSLSQREYKKPSQKQSIESVERNKAMAWLLFGRQLHAEDCSACNRDNSVVE